MLADSAAALANPWIAGLLTKSILEGESTTLPAFQWILAGWFVLPALGLMLAEIVLRNTLWRSLP